MEDDQIAIYSFGYYDHDNNQVGILDLVLRLAFCSLSYLISAVFKGKLIATHWHQLVSWSCILLFGLAWPIVVIVYLCLNILAILGFPLPVRAKSGMAFRQKQYKDDDVR